MRAPRATYANVMSTLAVFIALGGVSWAAVTLPRNSVGTAQLKRNAVTATDVKSSAITSAKVKDRSLLAKDFRAGQLPKGAKGDAGVPGAAGATGAAGVKGDQGAVGPTEAVIGTLGITSFAPETIVATFNPVTTTKAGRLYVSAVVERTIRCQSTFQVSITVDDVTLGASTQAVDVAGDPGEVDVFALDGVTSAVVAPGQHTVKIIGDCVGFAPVTNTLSAASFKAIVLGS